MTKQVMIILVGLKAAGHTTIMDPNDNVETDIDYAMTLLESWSPEALESFILDFGPMFLLKQPEAAASNVIYVDFHNKRRVA